MRPALDGAECQRPPGRTGSSEAGPRKAAYSAFTSAAGGASAAAVTSAASSTGVTTSTLSTARSAPPAPSGDKKVNLYIILTRQYTNDVKALTALMVLIVDVLSGRLGHGVRMRSLRRLLLLRGRRAVQWQCGCMWPLNGRRIPRGYHPPARYARARAISATSSVVAPTHHLIIKMKKNLKRVLQFVKSSKVNSQ